MTSRAEQAEIDRAYHVMEEHEAGRVKTVPMSRLMDAHLADPRARAAFERRRLAFQLGQQVRAWREDAGITQAELAARIGTSQTTIARLEAGGREPAVSTLTRIAAALGGTIEVVLRKAS